MATKKTIWKVPLTIGKVIREIPADARFLKADEQYRAIAAWFMCTRDSPLETRCFHVIVTDHDVPDNCEYIGTVQMPPYVWHVFVENRT